MKKPATALAIDTHPCIPVISLGFEQNHGLNQQFFYHESSKIREIYAAVSKKELRRIIDPLDDTDKVAFTT